MAELVKANPVKKRIVLCCAHDEHSLDAVYEAYKEGIVEPVFVGKEEEIKKICADEGFDFGDVTIYNEDDDIEAAKKAVQLIREGTGRKDHVACRTVPGPELSQGSSSDRWRHAASA